MYEQIIELRNKLIPSTALNSYTRRLDDIFPNAYGSLVTSQDAKSVAKEVSRCCSTRRKIRSLAITLDVSCSSLEADKVDANQVHQIIKKWREQSGENAAAPVLTDALQDCDLDEVISRCFDELEEDAVNEEPIRSESSYAGKSEQLRMLTMPVTFTGI